ncbi:MOSC domain-containing protein [Flavobacterium frigoris]|uniref:MOSC domain-containing protein n=1 Tax=Flavobacterium frigoris TaxID=229204 RepID=UPI0021CD7AD7|nr:MOSC domain-containing protein [Flavobacterium frigoris]
MNSSLNVAIPMKEFRPNFIFTGGEVYEEETWSEFTRGNLAFYGVKPCGRCVMVGMSRKGNCCRKRAFIDFVQI